MKKINFSITPLVTLLLVVMPVLMKGQLAKWSNGNTSANMPLSFTATGVDATSTSTSRIGLGYTSSGARWNSNGWTSSGNYIQITVTAATGYVLNLNSSYIIFNMGSSNTGPSSLTLYSSVNGYASVVANVTTVRGSSVQQGNRSYTLPSTGYDGLSSITFRLYGVGATGSSGTCGPSYLEVGGSAAAAGPSVNNPAVSNVLDTSATLSANLATNGGQTILERGFVWATTTNPLAGGGGVTKVITSGTSTGTFTENITNFPAGTRVYFKGYARTSGGYYYTSEVSFITLSKEPGAYPGSFTATAISKNSIKLDWTQVSGANGYLIIQRQGVAPTGSPADKTAYSINQALGDGTVVGVITSGATITTTVNGLLQGTRYYYTLFPFGYNGVNVETYNYRTVPVVPVANDSTLGYPPSNKSIIDGITSSEAAGIPSILNEAITTNTKGTQVWKLAVRDGGPAMNDDDDLPTIVTRITLNKAQYNTVANWSTSLLSAGLVDDSTGAVIATGTVTANSIVFNGINVTAADNNFKTVTVRLSLKSIAHIDRDTFRFAVDQAGTITKTAIESSQMQAFVSMSDSSKNTIDVDAVKLRFTTQPQAVVEEGAYLSNSIIVDVVDAFNSRDIDFTGVIQLDAVDANLVSGPHSKTAVKGVVVFDTMRFNNASLFDTLVATSGILLPARSNKFVVEVSKGSDIIADGSYIYPKNIVHTDYNDTDAITLTNSLEVMSLFLRDGGANDDNDYKPTVLTGVTINTTNDYLIRKAALYSGTTKLAQVDNFTTSGPNQQLEFTGFTLIAPDNDSAAFTLRVTFKDSAVDGDNFGFTIASATADVTKTNFATADAGGAASLISAGNNSVDVVGRLLTFLQQPTDVSEGSTQLPHPMVAAVDSFGNFDLLPRSYTVKTYGTSVFDFRAKISANTVNDGSATFTKLIYSTPATGVRIAAYTAGLDSVLSDTFEVMKPTWFRTIKSGVWSDTLVWEFSKNYGTNWFAANIAPDYSIHGQITIRNGDTVWMNGITPAENTIDEVTVEKGAVLFTPQGSYNRITVVDGIGTDFVIEGKLIHNNPVAGNGIDITTPATVLVKKGGAVELSNFGDAAHWAGNKYIRFEDSSFYIHNTSIPNTINAVTMFPNATTEVPVFKVAQNYNYPGSFVNPLGTLTINGLLTIDGGKTLTINGGGQRLLRNGIAADGNLVIADSSKVIITGNAQISGTGKISVNHSKALFQVGVSSYTTLANNKEITTTAANGITVTGTLNGLANGFTGNAVAKTEALSTVITAHAQGLGGVFGTSGNKNYNTASQFVFNGSVTQNSGNTQAITARTIKVDNILGLNLSAPVTVTDTLYIGQSNVSSSNTALLTIDKNGVIDGYSATSFINGPLNMWVDNGSTVYYPVGKTTFGAVTYISTGAATWVTLEYNNNNPHTSSFDTAKRGEGLAKINANEFWSIKSSVITSGSVEIPYTTNSAVAGEDTVNIRVVSWNGTRWNSNGPAARTATSGSVIADGLANYSVFTIGIDSACTTPAVPAFTNLNVCIGNPVILNATGTGIVRWFISNTDNQPFTSGNTVDMGVLLTDTVFYAEVKNIGCYSGRVAYPVKINQIPVAPVINGTTQLCYNTTALLNANAGGTNNWYTTDNATTPVFVGDAFTTASLLADTAYYVEKEQNGCYSPRTKVDVMVRAVVVSPVANSIDICSGQPGILDAAANNTIRWYENSTAATPFFTGSRYATSALVADSVYYIEAFDGTCASAKVPVTAHVLALPTAPVIAPAAVCAGNAANITATGTGTIYWYNDVTTPTVNSGTSFTSAPLFNNRTYYANVFDGKCFSNKVPVTVDVFTAPVAAVTSVAANVPVLQATAIQTPAIAQNYSWDFGTDATPATATGAGPHNVSWGTKGTKTVKLTMWNGNTVAACSTEVLSYVEVGAGLGLQDIAGATVAIYPNPASSAITLDITFETAQAGNITLIDATGKTVYNNAFGLSGKINSRIDVSGFAKGLYMVKIETNAGVTVQKVIVE